MKKIRLLIVFIFIAISNAAMADSGVVLLLRNGTSFGFSFKDKPVVIAKEAILTMGTKGNKVVFPFADIQRIFNSDTITTTQINNIKINNVVDLGFSLGNDDISITGLRPKDYVSIYSIDGKLLLRRNSDGNIMTINTLDFEHNVYIIKTSTGLTFKFVK